MIKIAKYLVNKSIAKAIKLIVPFKQSSQLSLILIDSMFSPALPFKPLFPTIPSTISRFTIAKRLSMFLQTWIHSQCLLTTASID